MNYQSTRWYIGQGLDGAKYLVKETWIKEPLSTDFSSTQSTSFVEKLQSIEIPYSLGSRPQRLDKLIQKHLLETSGFIGWLRETGKYLSEPQVAAVLLSEGQVVPTSEVDYAKIS